MTSFGLGEMLLVGLLILISFDIKHIVKVLRWLRTWRNKFFSVQSEWRTQMEQLVSDQETTEQLEKSIHSAQEMRKWGEERVLKLPSLIRHQASNKIVEKIEGLEAYKKAAVVACYSALHDEIDTTPLLNKILEDGKTLVLPFIKQGVMSFAPIETLGKDTIPGALGILEPLEDLREKSFAPIDFFVIPGRCFDEFGGRIGRGKGFYDKYLAEHSTGYKVGYCFDVQISPKKLDLEFHDKLMDATVSEKRELEHKKG